MSKFKVGQRVREISTGEKGVIEKFADMEGEEHSIYAKQPWIRWEDGALLRIAGCLIEDATPTTTEDTSKFHKHHDLIIAWAKGAKIQYFSYSYNEWKDINTPSWGETEQYRIKPEVTYSVGQKFNICETTYLLCSPASGNVVPVCIESGLRYCEMKKVNDSFKITEEEICEIFPYGFKLVK